MRNVTNLVEMELQSFRAGILTPETHKESGQNTFRAHS
jgi:hypothetical protein